MLIYLVFFAITIASMAVVLKITGKRKKIQLLLLVACCLPLCWLACMRDNSVGTDIEVYIRPVFLEASRAKSLAGLIKSRPDTEIGYLALNWIVSRFSTDFRVYLFVFELIVLSLFVIGMYRISRGNKRDVLLCCAFILLLFYNRSYNAARQMLSISIIIVGACNFVKGDIKKTLPYIIIAFLFHESALFLLPILLIGRIKKPEKRVLAYFLLCLAIASYKAIIVFFISRGVLPSKFLQYTDDYIIGFNINIVEEMLRVVLIIACLGSVVCRKDNEVSMSRVIIITDVILLQLGCFVEYASRICWYLLALYPAIITTTKTPANGVRKGVGRYYFLIVALLMYWLWSIAYCGYGETVPYVFSSGL